jgi:putative membrane protein
MIMKTTILNKKHLLALGVSALAVTAFGDDMNSTVTVAPPSGTAVTNQLHRMGLALPITSQGFVTDAAMGGMKEVVFGKEALGKSQNAEVKRFAAIIVKDHTMANHQLKQIAEEEGLSLPTTNAFATDDPMWSNPLLTDPESVHGAQLLMTNATYVPDYQALTHLKSLTGPAFDQAYVSDMVSDHAEDIPKFEAAARDLSDARLKQFAQQQLPALRKHYRMAQDLAGKLAGTAAPGSDELQSSAGK